MTVEEFIVMAEGYYAPYNIVQKEVVNQWLSHRTAKALELIWAEVLKAFSAVYKTPPTVKELEDAWDKVIQERREELRPPALPAPKDRKADKRTAERLFADIWRKLGKAEVDNA